MAFATVEQYLARYPDTTAPEQAIDALLEDATDAIEGELAPRGIDWEGAGEDFAAKLARVCCIVAHRAIPVGDGSPAALGATQTTQTAGSYSFSASYSNGYGEVYLSKSDRIKLGIADGTYVYAEPFGGEDVSC